jgi:predicted AAA+ superfamily ATPase
MKIERIKKQDVIDSLLNFPVVALIGPRQCGKSTLVKQILLLFPESIYLDMERPSDLQKLDNAEWFLTSQKDKLICIDEIQRKPELFPLIRSLVDEWQRPGCFLILGSASRDLLLQSSESLAGRISYKRLTPFLYGEISDKFSMETYFSNGAFPRSILAKTPKLSFEWRQNFIWTFLERDLKFWSGFTPTIMRRMWQMLAHINGQILNYSAIGNSLGVSSATIKNYIDLLENTYMVEVIPPYISNLGKRLVKSPKIYIADSGIAAALIQLQNFEALSGHPVFGSLWEQIVVSNLKGHFEEAEFFFYRTNHGAECDFVIKLNNKIFAIECKASYSPNLSKGNYNAFEDIQPNHIYIVTTNPQSWTMSPFMDVVSLSDLIQKIKEQIET